MENKLSLVRRVIPDKVQQAAGRQALKMQKHAPHILFAAGLVGFGATVVLASRATLKVEGVVDEFNEKKEEMKMALEGPSPYSQNDYNHDLVLIYVKAGLDGVRLYGPAVVCGTVAVACLTKSHAMLTARNAALSTAYTALDRAFSDYRTRVSEEIGVDRERSLYRGESELVVQDSKTGERTKQLVQDSDGYSVHSRFFDEFNQNYQPNAEMNFYFLKAQQNMLNDRLRARGHLFLNEVYDALGMERSGQGAVCGWVLNGEGDNFVDFGLFNGEKVSSRRFVNGLEPAIRLDFNVNPGLIYDKI